jgi:hypothetical protein
VVHLLLILVRALVQQLVHAGLSGQRLFGAAELAGSEAADDRRAQHDPDSGAHPCGSELRTLLDQAIDAAREVAAAHRRPRHRETRAGALDGARLM